MIIFPSFVVLDHSVRRCYNLFVMAICSVGTCNSRSGRDKKIAFFLFQKTELETYLDIKMPKNVFQSVNTRRKALVESDFDLSRSFATSLGYQKTLGLQLKSEAIPTVIPEPPKL